jgi:hypothetical protein
MYLIRIIPVLISRLRTSGSVSVANRPHCGHSKSPNSTTSIGALALPITYPSDCTEGSVGIDGIRAIDAFRTCGLICERDDAGYSERAHD